MSVDYKNTLILPDTTFPMRGNLPKNEPLVYQRWFSENCYQKMRQRRTESTKHFNLHDGPPYANGELHIGHALNKILKDIITKVHYFRGEDVYYVPGWDCHGLPIEQQIEKSLGKAKKDSLPKPEIRELCRKHASKYIDIQKKGFLELGVIGDFENPYKTMDFAFEANIYRCLCAIAQKGLLVERKKPVYWSWACQTALAEAEVEYKEKQSDSVFVAFKLDTDALEKINAKNASVVIWTTTPWTLPANVAIALRPHTKYVLSDDGFIIAKDLFEKCHELGIVKGAIIDEFDSHCLEYCHAINPLNNRKSMFVLGEHVLLDEGTGCVHTATGHGDDDYNIGLAYQLDIIMPVDDRGCFDETITRLGLLPAEFLGQHIYKAQPRILELLGTSLLLHSVITHSYPHCWRSHEPVIFRATKQWFIVMDKPFTQNQQTLRDIALDELRKVDFYPKNGIKRIASMIENRPDWCVSRQRDWGVPIAFLRHKNTQEIVLDSVVLDHIAALFEQYGCDLWWEKSVAEILPLSYKERADEFEKIEHILDVWFDSGSTWNAVLKSGNYKAGGMPADMYLEGSDQHRGWFQSSLLISCAVMEHAPYKSIVTHGFTMDKNGDKMSKSKGNVILPKKIIQDFGSEILRLWVAMSDYQNDQNISDFILKQTAEHYRKIRNTLRFLLANTSDLDTLHMNHFSAIDCWILATAKDVFAEVNNAMCEYDFSKAVSLLSNFIVNELSGIYMDLCKDILYCDSLSSPRRRSVQTAMALLAQKLFELLAPILTYTIDEAISHAKGYLATINQSVFDLLYTPLPPIAHTQNFDDLLRIRSIFLENVDMLKKNALIKSTLELSLITPSNFEFSDMHTWLMVSNVGVDIAHKDVIAEFEYDGQIFKLAYSAFHKCPRCWQFLAKKADVLCERCSKVVQG